MAKRPIRIYKRSPVPTATREPVQVYENGHNQDQLSITQLVVDHSKEQLARSEQAGEDKYEELLHSIYDAVVITDLEGNISEVNARTEHSFGWPRDDLGDMNIIDIISGADHELLRFVRKNVTNKKYTVLEAVCLRADETRFHSEIAINRFRGKGKKSLCFFIRDISARKEAEGELRSANEQLVEAEKMQARVDTLSTLFYELNNPLQILTCMAELDENKEYKKQISRIVSVLDQLRRQESMEAMVDDEGATRFDIPERRELEACDPKKLLVVDDERMLRDMFVRALESSFPYLDVDAVGDGQAAANLFREHRHSVIIMDISMPVMNGEEAFDVIREVCAQEGWTPPRFIFCTGFVISDRLKGIVSDGSEHACLSKPLTISDLVESVRGCLAQPTVV